MLYVGKSVIVEIYPFFGVFLCQRARAAARHFQSGQEEPRRLADRHPPDLEPHPAREPRRSGAAPTSARNVTADAAVTETAAHTHTRTNECRVVATTPGLP